MGGWRRVAQPLNLAALPVQLGAPSFAQFAKGGNHGTYTQTSCARKGSTLCPLHRYPPYQKRKDGHPAMGWMDGRYEFEF